MSVTKKIQGLGRLPQANIFSEIPDFTRAVHVRENRPENENHLNANRQKFTGQCAIVLSLLQKGVVLSSYSAMVQHHVGHLARRIKDLKDNFGISIQDQFEYEDDGRATRNKLWFMYVRLTEATKLKYKIHHPAVINKMKNN